jgi:hypothetical protein
MTGNRWRTLLFAAVAILAIAGVAIGIPHGNAGAEELSSITAGALSNADDTQVPQAQLIAQYLREQGVPVVSASTDAATKDLKIVVRRTRTGFPQDAWALTMGRREAEFLRFDGKIGADAIETTIVDEEGRVVWSALEGIYESPRVQWRLSCLSPASSAGTCSR